MSKRGLILGWRRMGVGLEVSLWEVDSCLDLTLTYSSLPAALCALQSLKQDKTLKKKEMFDDANSWEDLDEGDRPLC